MIQNKVEINRLPNTMESSLADLYHNELLQVRPYQYGFPVIPFTGSETGLPYAKFHSTTGHLTKMSE